MKTLKTLVILLFFTVVCNAQYNTAEEVLAEGKLLYRMEMGSWYGTDHFLANFGSKRDSLGGYLSYENNDDHTITTIFMNAYKPDEVLVRYVFDSVPKTEPLGIDTLSRKMYPIEKDLAAIRANSYAEIKKDTTSFFTYYQNTSYNLIPLIKDKKRLVYILTGPSSGSSVLIGNDYLLTFNKKNEFEKKEKLHNSLLAFSYKGEDGTTLTDVVHSHIVTDLITVTDICTLLMYKPYVEWTKHIVMGPKHVSIFNLEDETLLVLTNKAYNKILEGED